MSGDRDYVLGTHDDEIARLGKQHEYWRPTVGACWQRAGLREGQTVVDVGCGPGFATLDLAERVGPTGRVHAVERSTRFLDFLRGAATARGITNISPHELDLMECPLPTGPYDAAWCRWVASFVESPKRLVEQLYRVLKPGGVAVFHEYVDYGAWRMVPRRPLQEEFVERVMSTWRANGGEPDIALVLPGLLTAAGFRIRYAEPRIFALRPQDAMWQWTGTFIRVNSARMVELGTADAAWAKRVVQELEAAEADPASFTVTPMVLELVAEKP